MSRISPILWILKAETAIDAVIHLAAQVSVANSFSNPLLDAQTNLLGLNHMLVLSAKYKVKKFIFASSAAVYGNSPKIPLTEIDLCDPMSPYGINKWMGELSCTQWCRAFGLNTICFRFSNVYGPRQSNDGEGGVISLFIERMLAGRELIVYGNGGQTRDFIYVEDIANALVSSLDCKDNGIFNLSRDEEISILQLIEHLEKLHHVSNVVYQESRPGDIYRSRLSNKSIHRVLGWTPKVSFEEGLIKTYGWHKSRSNVALG